MSKTTYVAPAVGLVVGLVVWYLSSAYLFEFLPSPYETAEEFYLAATSAEFYGHFAATIRRVLIGWVGAGLVGASLGIWMGSSWKVDALFHPWVFVGLALPGPVSILFAILALGLGELTSLVALWAVVTPFVTTIVYGAAKGLDSKLLEMARTYHLSRPQQIREIILPALTPALLAAARVGFAMSWKIVVLVEALSRTTGIGAQLRFFFAFNQPDGVIAWTLTFAVVMVLVEVFFFQRLGRKLFAWRTEAVV